jgi:ABC-2 type transport system permease protein
MINNQIAMIKREIWEHRSIFVTPIAIGSVVSLGVLMMLMFASGLAAELDKVIFGAQNLVGEAERKAVLTVFFLGTSWIFVVALAFLTVFYSLDSLYAERKDKSILFWRSLPVTDAETVISKLLTAMLVIPAIMAVGIFATHLINLIVTGIWVAMKGGDAGTLIWGSVSLFDNWATAFIVLVASGIWMSPFIGWFLFVSTWSKRMPILMAFMPPIVIALGEGIIFRSHIFLKAVTARGEMTPLFKIGNLEQFFEEEQWREGVGALTLLDKIDLIGFFTSPALWGGLLVCALFVSGAIYVRRYRDES